MATNLDMLADLKNAIFVDEVLSKTRDGGLPWAKIAADRYTVTICEPPFCLNPYDEGWIWIINVTKLRIGDDYIISLDVLANESAYIRSDSRQDATIDVLFSQIERVMAGQLHQNRGITFISNIPNAPSTAVSDFVMCGGVTVGGNAKVMTICEPSIIPAGVSVAGLTSSFVQTFPSIGGGVTVNGDHDVQSLFEPQIPSAGNKGSGAAVINMIWTQTDAAGAQLGGTATVSVG